MPRAVAEQLAEVYDLIDELESVGARLRAKADAAVAALREGEPCDDEPDGAARRAGSQ
jgi:hypothetical protein